MELERNVGKKTSNKHNQAGKTAFSANFKAVIFSYGFFFFFCFFSITFFAELWIDGFIYLRFLIKQNSEKSPKWMSALLNFYSPLHLTCQNVEFSIVETMFYLKILILYKRHRWKLSICVWSEIVEETELLLKCIPHWVTGSPEDCFFSLHDRKMYQSLD